MVAAKNKSPHTSQRRCEVMARPSVICARSLLEPIQSLTCPRDHLDALGFAPAPFLGVHTGGIEVAQVEIPAALFRYSRSERHTNAEILNLGLRIVRPLT